MGQLHVFFPLMDFYRVKQTHIFHYTNRCIKPNPVLYVDSQRLNNEAGHSPPPLSCPLLQLHLLCGTQRIRWDQWYVNKRRQHMCVYVSLRVTRETGEDMSSALRRRAAGWQGS